jgi:hypothetical protein
VNGSHLGTPGFVEHVRAVHPGKDLRWVGQPIPTHGAAGTRALYLSPGVHNGFVPVGLESEAKHCLCQGSKPTTADTALYTVATAAPLNVTGGGGGGSKGGGSGGGKGGSSGGKGSPPPPKGAGNARLRL